MSQEFGKVAVIVDDPGVVVVTHGHGENDIDLEPSRRLFQAVEESVIGFTVWPQEELTLGAAAGNYVATSWNDLARKAHEQIPDGWRNRFRQSQLKKGNVIRAHYDTLGQLVILESPDMGRTEYLYDLAGNLGAKETANLRSKTQLIRYQYTYNRLDGIDYPETRDVQYTYAPPGRGTQTGRIVLVRDESGKEERFYGRMGEVTRAT